MAELKRALPQAHQVERSQSQTDYSSPLPTPQPTMGEFSRQQSHNISSSSRMESTSQTPISPLTSFSTNQQQQQPSRTYSSDDDDDDVEIDVDIFQRGKKIQRHYSESTYDRTDRSGGGGYNTSTVSSRAPSQQSYTETPFPICPPTPYVFTNRPISPPGKPPRSPKAIRRYQGATSVYVICYFHLNFLFIYVCI